MAYAYRRSLTIDHTKVPNTDQSNFPVLVYFSDPSMKTAANGGHVQSASGYDIVFSSNGGLSGLLNWEIETYDPVNGILWAWVQIASVSHTSDTVFYMLYGNASITTPQNTPADTWDGNYTAVYHLANGSTLSATDSTSNGNNGVNHGATAATGQIDGGAQFASSSHEYIDLGNGSSLQFGSGGGLTLECWVYYTGPTVGLSSQKRLISKIHSGGSGYNGWELLLNNTGPNSPGFYIQLAANNTFNNSPNAAGFAANTWFYVTGIYDGNNAAIYVNGVLKASLAYGAGAFNAETVVDALIGDFSDSAGSSGNEWDGIIDEVRISKVNRSQDWITTCFNNQNSPSTFLTAGAETNTQQTATFECDIRFSIGFVANVSSQSAFETDTKFTASFAATQSTQLGEFEADTKFQSSFFASQSTIIGQFSPTIHFGAIFSPQLLMVATFEADTQFVCFFIAQYNGVHIDCLVGSAVPSTPPSTPPARTGGGGNASHAY